jgi:hypothetical protein
VSAPATPVGDFLLQAHPTSIKSIVGIIRIHHIDDASMGLMRETPARRIAGELNRRANVDERSNPNPINKRGTAR